jgi:hypothetical protein
MSTRKWNGSLGRRVFNAVQHLEDYHGITVPSYELDFGRFRRREREHFPCAARYGTEFLCCLGLAGT